MEKKNSGTVFSRPSAFSAVIKSGLYYSSARRYTFEVNLTAEDAENAEESGTNTVSLYISTVIRVFIMLSSTFSLSEL